MAPNATNSWEKIQQSIKDVERLMGQKEYNSSMVKARQTLEFMVKLQAERAGIAEIEDLKGLIENLYQNRWISKTTYEHYTTIRIIGNKAVHEDYANAYDANQAFHLLSQEIYTFANNYRNAKRGTRPTQSRSSKSRTSQSSASPSRSTSGNRSVSAAGARSRKRPQQKNAGFNVYDLLKLAIPVLCILLLFIVIKLVKPSSDPAPTTTAAATTEASTLAPTTAATPETSETVPVYKTTTNLNVRPEPNTDQERIGRLESGTIVEYVRDYDENWAVILYEGQEAYVSSQYLTTE